MPGPHTQTSGLMRWGFWILLAWVLATALQLQQASLYSGWIYGGLLAAGLIAAGLAFNKKSPPRWRGMALILAAALSAFAATGLRAHLFLDQSLDARLQGPEITVTGVVAAMVQRSDTGLRFRLDVESARQGTTEVRLPPKIYLSWYGQAAAGAGYEATLRPMDLRPGERWQMVVRLKVPHGGSNPHGFDYELWLWEQGLQATGYVRAGPANKIGRAHV